MDNHTRVIDDGFEVGFESIKWYVLVDRGSASIVVIRTEPDCLAHVNHGNGLRVRDEPRSGSVLALVLGGFGQGR